jgi:hypothetical protein
MNDREIAERITDAYRKLTAGPGSFVTIAAIADVSGVHPDDLAAMLIRLYEDGQVNLISRDNQHALTGRERDAGIWCGGEYKHLMSMGG